MWASWLLTRCCMWVYSAHSFGSTAWVITSGRLSGRGTFSCESQTDANIAGIQATLGEWQFFCLSSPFSHIITSTPGKLKANISSRIRKPSAGSESLFSSPQLPSPSSSICFSTSQRSRSWIESIRTEEFIRSWRASEFRGTFETFLVCTTNFSSFLKISIFFRNFWEFCISSVFELTFRDFEVSKFLNF